MSFVIDEIKHLLRCAHCLNHGASNKVIITNKVAPNGDDPGRGVNGEAVAYMCDTHKEIEPKFAHQFVDGNINVINVEQLADNPPPTQPAQIKIQEKPTQIKLEEIPDIEGDEEGEVVDDIDKETD
jgi:hypothetical protein